MSAASERRLRSDAVWVYIPPDKIQSPFFSSYTSAIYPLPENGTKVAKKEGQTMKESMLMVAGKRDGREYGVNYRMRAVSFSGSSPFHIFSPMVFMSL